MDIIIAAAGSGSRFSTNKNDKPKQFTIIDGKEILSLNIKKWILLKDKISIENLYVVLPQKDFDYYLKKYSEVFNNIIFIKGGKSRGESILNALKISTSDYVMIHDGARPFFSNNLIKRINNKIKNSDAVIPILNITDTLKIVKDSRVVKTLNRDNYFMVQTPQAFKREIILKAYLESEISAFDDSQLLEKLNIKIDTVLGEWNNIKITTPDQNKLIEFLMLQED